MEANKKRTLPITRDDFLEQLMDEKGRWSPEAVRHLIGTPKQLDLLYGSICEYIEREGLAETQVSPKEGIGAGTLPLMLGKTIHVNLSKLKESSQLQTVVAGSAVLLSALPMDNYNKVVAMIPLIISLVSKLRKQLGEVCVVEVIREYYDSNKMTGANTEMIAYELNEQVCRYPASRCRYEEGGKCTIKVDNIKKVIDRLRNKVIKPCTNDEPPEWCIRL